MRKRLSPVLLTLSMGVVLTLLVRAKLPHSQAAEPPRDPVVDALGGKKWLAIFEGVDHVELYTKKPRLMQGYAVRIDLTAKGIEFIASPGLGEKDPGKADGLKTSTFLKKQKCQVAINAAPFTPVGVAEGKPQTIPGLQISKGELVSKERSSFGAVLLTKDNQATIGYPPFELKGVYNAVGGFTVVLKKGEVVKVAKADLHPRSAIGVSEDGKTLYLLVIDGRQPLHSEGASEDEVGEWLKLLGASEGLNLDGGGSSSLVIEGPDHKAKILNRPINNRLLPGSERVCPSHLGVMAKPLGK